MNVIVLNFFILQVIPSAFLFNGVKQTCEMTILSYGGLRLSATRLGEVQARLPRHRGQEEGDGGELQQQHEPRQRRQGP